MVGNHQTPIEKNGCLGYQVDMLGFDVFYPTSIASLTTWRRLTKAPAKEFCLKKNMEKMNISSPMKASTQKISGKIMSGWVFIVEKIMVLGLRLFFFNKKWMLRLILPNLWPGVVFIGVAKNGDGIFNRPSFCSPWEVVGTPNGWWWRWMDLQHLEAAELNPESRIRRKSSKAPNLHWFWIEKIQMRNWEIEDAIHSETVVFLSRSGCERWIYLGRHYSKWFHILQDCQRTTDWCACMLHFAIYRTH